MNSALTTYNITKKSLDLTWPHKLWHIILESLRLLQLLQQVIHLTTHSCVIANLQKSSLNKLPEVGHGTVVVAIEDVMTCKEEANSFAERSDPTQMYSRFYHHVILLGAVRLPIHAHVERWRMFDFHVLRWKFHENKYRSQISNSKLTKNDSKVAWTVLSHVAKNWTLSMRLDIIRKPYYLFLLFFIFSINDYYRHCIK